MSIETEAPNKIVQGISAPAQLQRFSSIVSIMAKPRNPLMPRYEDQSRCENDSRFENDSQRDGENQTREVAISEPPDWNQDDIDISQYVQLVNDWTFEEIYKNPSSFEEIRRKGKIATQIALQDNEERHKIENQETEERQSVQKLEEIHHGYPGMRKNTAADASLPKATASLPKETASLPKETKNSNGKRVSEGQDGREPKRDRGPRHEPAKIKPLKDFNLSEIFKLFGVNYRELDKGKQRLVKSFVALELCRDWDTKGAELPHVNESCVSRYVCNIVKDAAMCLGLDSSMFHVTTEMSFFSMRPDIVSVHYGSQIIFCVEVKNPGRDPHIVMANEEAAGQCLDYTYGLRNLGIDVPIVCLSTYSLMRIGSCKESIKTILDEAIKRLNTVNAENPFCANDQTKKKYEYPSPEMKNRLEIPRDEQPNTPKNISVSKQNFKFKTPIKKFANEEDGGGDNSAISDDTQDDDDDDEIGEGGNREIFFSETIGLKDMLKGFYLAIACAIVSAKQSSAANGNQTTDRIPKEGELVAGKYYNLVQAESYAWRKISDNIKATFALKEIWRKDVKIYLKEVLGMGSTGKVYLAMDSSGRHFAIKMLFFDSKTMKQFDPNENMKEREQQREELGEQIAEEAKRWREIYPEYKKSIYEMKLNGLPCFAMPYVGSIKRSDRAKLIPSIREEMMRILDLGYKYNRKDIRWRHMGLRCDKESKTKLVFVDLESMEKEENISTREEKNAAVDFFISELEKKDQDDESQ